MQIRRTAAALTSAAALSVTGIAMATPAQAAPLVAGGLVAVNVSDIEIIDDSEVLTFNDVLSNNNVGVGAALAVAANICEVNVNVLATQLRDGQATCRNAVEDTQVDLVQNQ